MCGGNQERDLNGLQDFILAHQCPNHTGNPITAQMTPNHSSFLTQRSKAPLTHKSHHGVALSQAQPAPPCL